MIPRLLGVDIRTARIEAYAPLILVLVARTPNSTKAGSSLGKERSRDCPLAVGSGCLRSKTRSARVSSQNCRFYPGQSWPLHGRCGPLSGCGYALSRSTTRATVVWVQTRPPLGVGTPRWVSARASPAFVFTPALRSAANSRASRCAVRVACSPRDVAAAAAQGGTAGLHPLSPPSTAPLARAAASAARVRSEISSRSFCAMAA